MSPRTPSEWHHQANSLISNAYSSQVDAVRQSEQSKKAHADTFNDNIAMYQDLHGTLEGKVQTSHRLIEKLEVRLVSVQQNTELTKTSLLQLEAAYTAKTAPIKLCAWRMEQRQKRPLREHVRDQVEIALEDERAILADTQRKLQEAMVVTKNMIIVLGDQDEELKGIIDQKMQALSVDELCLRTTHRSWAASATGSRAQSAVASRVPSGAATPRRLGGAVVAEVSTKNEIKRQQTARNNDVAAKKREEASIELRSENEKLVARCHKAVKDACARVEKSLQERIVEVTRMRKRLENELKETQGKVGHTKSTISETQSQIHAIQEPIALCSTHASWRKQRADRERIQDPVECQLENQKQKLLRATEELRTHRQSEKTVLTALGEQVERLKEDLKDKTTALNIDVTCLQNVGESRQPTPAATPRGSPPSARGKLGTAGAARLGMMVDNPLNSRLQSRMGASTGF